MRQTRRRILGAVAASASLTGCLGDGGATDTPTDDGGSGSVDTDTPAGGPAVQVRSHPDLGDILAGPDGMTLYMFDSDTRGAGASTCSGGCASVWPPLTVDGEATAGDGVTADLATFERDDGSTQVAAGGWPLYYYDPDSAPGDATGQGANGVWWVLRPDGTPVRPDMETDTPTDTPTDSPTATAAAGPAVQVRSHDDLGDVLVGPEEMTLYMFDQDTQGGGASACTGGCASAWPPLTVGGEPAAGDGVAADLTTFERDDGDTQVAANGWPLYYYASDGSPGDATGQGANGVWWVLRPDGTPVRSSGETETPTPTETGGGPGDY